MILHEIPYLYTREAWAELTTADRARVALHRRRAVEWAQMEHDRRFHGTDNLLALSRALRERNPTDAP